MIKAKTVNILANPKRALNAKWTIETSADLDYLHPFAAPVPLDTNLYNNIFESIARTLHHKYKVWQRGPTLEDEITAIMAEEIQAELDKELLADIIKQAKGK